MTAELGNDVVRVETSGHTLVVTLTREAKRNALSPEVTQGVDAAMNRLEDDPELWCGVLTGGTSVFSAGADLAQGVGEPTERGGLVGLIRRRRTKPLIAAVEGLALGGGMELVMCCDLVVAARDAAFGLPEVKRGLIPDFGGVFRVGRYLPPNVARELLLTGRRLDAERAERLGFVNVLTEPGGALDAALALADEIAANAPLAVREALAIVNEPVLHSDEGEWERTEAAHQRLLKSEDVREGVTAFFERRPPEWKAR
jgi:enoyl-CoA hydratase